MLSIKSILYFGLVLAVACGSDSTPEEVREKVAHNVVYLANTYMYVFKITLYSQPAVGDITTLTGDDLEDAEKILNGSLTKLASGDGPSYK